MTRSIDIRAALVFGWETLRANFSFFLKLLVALIGVSILPGMILTKLAVMFGPVGLLVQFLNLAWQAVVAIGVLKICLKLYDRQIVDISDLWSGMPMILDYIVVKFIFTVIVSVGLVLLIVPGLIWMMQFYWASYVVVDKGAGAMAALKTSSTITDGVKWDLTVFASVTMALNILGLLCFGVGIIITLPVSMLAAVYVYRQLLQQTHGGGGLAEVK